MYLNPLDIWNLMHLKQKVHVTQSKENQTFA